MAMEGPDITATTAVIDNGAYGRREIRFETGRLAQQAAGAVSVYLDDDTMVSVSYTHLTLPTKA